MSEDRITIDGLVVGGGIAGLQAALDLADQGFEVLIVEKEPSIGGKMIALSKVFPTLDCSSCICTPRMAAAVKTLGASCVARSYEGEGHGFDALVWRQAAKACWQDRLAFLERELRTGS